MNDAAPHRPRTPWIWIAAVALAAALPYALKIAADRDLWWHVRTGQMILETATLPTSDPFSFTARGASWTNHEWLSDVVVAAVYAAGGDRALSAWRAFLLVAAMTGFTALLWRRLPHPLFVLGGVLLAAPLLRIFLNLRPHSYTYLFAILLVGLLESARKRPHLLWIAPPLLALWTNLHGGFILGWGILGAFLAERWLGLDGLDRRPDRGERTRLALVFGACLVAPVLNPYGPGLFAYLARELGADHSLILEWRGIWYFEQERLHFALLCAIPLAAVGWARRVGSPAALLLLAVSGLATWIHGRFLILLVIFSCLVTFTALADGLARVPRLANGALLRKLRAPRWAWGLCALPLLAGVLQLSVDLSRKGLRLQIPREVPVEACEFLRAHDLGPNLLSRLDWGGYAIWHLYPDYRVAADGRNLTVYDAEFVDGLLRAYDTGSFTAYANRYDVDVILSEAAGPTYRELRADGEWIRIHEDRIAAVFARREAARNLDERRVRVDAAQPASERFFFP